MHPVDIKLTTPSAALIDDMASLNGDLLVLGAGGKLGPSLVALAAAALRESGSSSRVVAVSRYGDAETRARIEASGAVAVSADVASASDRASLPDAAEVVYLIGAKFGTTGNTAGTWATNAYLPGAVMERFAGSRVSALSTGNVYPLVDVRGTGSVETDQLEPVGEYAMSCLGRERVLTHFAERDGTRLSLVRLNYAVEGRYGVLVDIAETILRGDPVDLTTGWVNVCWQGYANEVILRALLHAGAPPFTLNLSGPERLEVATLARALADRLGTQAEFVGEPAPTALLTDTSRCRALFGTPGVEVDELLDMTVDWIRSGQPRLGKPTKFQARDGRF